MINIIKCFQQQICPISFEQKIIISLLLLQKSMRNFFMMKNVNKTAQNLDSNHGTSSISSSGSGTILTDRSASADKQLIGIGIGIVAEEEEETSTAIKTPTTSTSRRDENNNRKQTPKRRPSFYSDFNTVYSSKVVLALKDYDDDLANITSSNSNYCSRHHLNHNHHNHDNTTTTSCSCNITDINDDDDDDIEGVVNEDEEEEEEEASSSSSSSCNSNCYNILSVDRDELQKISLLGKGQFCNVYLVAGSLPEPSSSSSSSQQQDQDLDLDEVLQHEQQERRPSLPLPPIAKRKMYAYKSIDPTRVSDANQLIVAASDLASEAKILSQLDHPNIIKLRGLCSEPFSTSFADDVENVSGSFNLDRNNKTSKNNHSSHNNSNGLEGYFLVLDVLTETLSKRLIRWRNNEDRIIAAAKSRANNSNNRSRRIIGLCNTNDAVVVDDTEIEAEIYDGKRSRMYKRIDSSILGIAKGMEYLSNQKNIVLRDLKPGNVGFDDDGNVRLFDFGMARNIDECTDANEICGSPRYLAPEVISGKGYTLKVDVYSFGILLFQVCSLQMPYAEYFHSNTNSNSNSNKNKNKLSSWWKNIVGGGGNNNKNKNTTTSNNNNNNCNIRTKCDGTPKDQQTVMVEEFYRRVVDMELRPACSSSDKDNLNFDMIVPCPHMRQLIEECWHTDPTKRPSFEDIVPRLLQHLFDQKCNRDINSSTKSYYSIM